MKRKTLKRNMKKVISIVVSEELPLDIKYIMIHGSFLRGSEELGDLDVMMFHDPNSQVRDFDRDFSDFRSLSELYDEFLKYKNSGWKLIDVVHGPLKDEIEKRGVPLSWVGVHSWSQLFGKTFMNLSFMLFRDIVTLKIVKKGTRGVHIQIWPCTDLEDIGGRLFTYRKLPLYQIWTSKTPDLIFLDPTDEEIGRYLLLEYNKLSTDVLYNRIFMEASCLLICKAIDTISTANYSAVRNYLLDNVPKSKYGGSEDIRKIIDGFGLRDIQRDLSKYILLVYSTPPTAGLDNNRILRESVGHQSFVRAVLINLWDIVQSRLREDRVETVLATAVEEWKNNAAKFSQEDIAEFISSISFSAYELDRLVGVIVKGEESQKT